MAKRNTYASNTIQAHLIAFSNSSNRIHWPRCRVSDLPIDEFDREAVVRIFDSVINGKPRNEWIDYEVENAAVNLALLEYDLSKLQRNLMAQGYTVPSPNNPAHQVRNPLLDAISMGFSLKSQLHKQLGLMFTHRQTLKNKTRLDNLAAIHSSADQKFPSKSKLLA